MRAGHILIDALDQNSQALKLPDALGPREGYIARKFLFAQEAVLDGDLAAPKSESVDVPSETGIAQNREGLGIDVRRRNLVTSNRHIMMVNIHPSKIKPDRARVDYLRGKRLRAQLLVDQ